MAELRPYPFGLLVRRMFAELAERGSIFDLARERFFVSGPERDLAVRFHGQRASTPLGPAAGPQSQMAQNLVLAWLGGSRILELKTVQVDDRLVIPRPCIDMQTVGYNVEWSQELRLAESLEEYVKGAMLIEMLIASGELGLAAGSSDTIFDMSVGYDLAGIQSVPVRRFLAGMLDCRAIVDRLRGEVPREWRHLAELAFRTRLSDTLTLSTFHGCPPDEIERIVDFLLCDVGLHSIVKLNPMLLGAARTRELLHDVMGYDDVHVPDSAFERDTSWEAAQGFCERLGATAAERGLGFGVKFSNTLIVENRRDFFPRSAAEMYLSGPPLHVLAMNLVQLFRERFGARWPISFSAGIERRNFPDAVALGLVPVTVCSDLLKPGGYARSRGYFDELGARMDAVGAVSIGDFAIRAYGNGRTGLDALGLLPDAPVRRACEAALDEGSELAQPAGALHERWVAECALLNTAHYVPRATADPRYARAANAKPPRKIGSALALFDCITCDKCVPVCPNDANFTFALPRLEVPLARLSAAGSGFSVRAQGTLVIEEQHQIANFADFCNDCGNCDVFCPEDGGPYLVKPRFFGSVAGWRASAALDGFALERSDGGERLFGRIGGRASSIERRAGAHGARTRYAGDGFELELDEAAPERDPLGTATREVDLTDFRILCWIRDAVYGDPLSYPALAAR